MHIKAGLLQAYQDRELTESQRSKVEQHLEACGICRDRLDRLVACARDVRRSFDALESDPRPPAHTEIRSRVEDRINLEMETKAMSLNLFSRKYRAIWASLVGVAVLAVVFAVPPARALAGKFLRLFRAEQIQTVLVNPEKVDEQFRKLRASPEFQKLIASSVQVEPKGTQEQVASAAEASIKAGIEIRVPKAAGEAAKWVLQPASHVEIQMDLERIRAILAEIGRDDIQLPVGLDGATVEVEVPRAAVGLFGDCGDAQDTEQDAEAERRAYLRPGCVVFSQILSPSVTAPEGLDIGEVATAMLQVFGLSEEEAAEFSRTTDWTTTLVVPIPRNLSSAETLQVDGVKGTLIVQKSRSGVDRYMLLWVKNEIIYALSGWGDKEKALSLAGSLS